MSHLDVSYKFGSAQAVEDFTSWLQDGMDNPTQAPPKLAAAITVLREALDKQAGCSKKRHGGDAPRAVRSSGMKSSRYSALKKKLAKKRGKRGPK